MSRPLAHVRARRAEHPDHPSQLRDGRCGSRRRVRCSRRPRLVTVLPLLPSRAVCRISPPDLPDTWLVPAPDSASPPPEIVQLKQFRSPGWPVQNASGVVGCP
jgi:hypothetical protein